MTPPTAPTVRATRRPADIDGSADTVAEVASGTTDANAETGLGEAPAKASAASGAADSLVGEILEDRYEITAKIGQGGMGAVYEARHTGIGKRVAVKVLLDKYAEKDQVVARLKQEAKLASSIGHANIIDITDVGVTFDGRTFVVMEFLEGESLGACIQRTGPLEPQRTIRFARQIASALGAAHDKGIVHRDVKPENVFLHRRGDSESVKVVDFGISKSMRPDDGDDSPRLTQTGMVLGTPLYMSPEQARGDENLDHRIDIYALGVILYEMVTGEVPYRGSNYLNILSQVISEDPPAPSSLRTDLDHDLESVILKAMAKDSAERYQTMAALDADLALLQSDGDNRSTVSRITAARWRRRRERKGSLRFVLWAAGVVALAAGVAFAVSATMRDSAPSAAIAAPAMVDAAVAAPEPAAEVPAEPVYEPATVTIVTEPPGATIFEDDRLVGVSPTPYVAEKKRGTVILRAELAGFEDGTIKVTPMIDDGREVRGKLQKLPDKKPRRRRRPPPRDRDDDSKRPPEGERDDTGDLMGNPHRRP